MYIHPAGEMESSLCQTQIFSYDVDSGAGTKTLSGSRCTCVQQGHLRDMLNPNFCNDQHASSRGS